MRLIILPGGACQNVSKEEMLRKWGESENMTNIAETAILN